MTLSQIIHLMSQRYEVYNSIQDDLWCEGALRPLPETSRMFMRAGALVEELANVPQ